MFVRKFNGIKFFYRMKSTLCIGRNTICFKVFNKQLISNFKSFLKIKFYYLLCLFIQTLLIHRND